MAAGRPGTTLATTPAGRLLAGISTGRLVSVAAMALAAFSALPEAPVVTAEATTNFDNLIKYQRALAEHAKRSNQIATLGAIAALLL